MSLNHVMMWSASGWQRVTVDDIKRLHPGGKVSARSGLFRCELCGQMVTLADGPIKGRFFKHSRGDKDKECPERDTGVAVWFEPERRPGNLPFRLGSISQNAFILEIGIILLPEVQNCAGTLMIRSDDGNHPFQYHYNLERLSTDRITYLPIGDYPALQYHLSFSDPAMEKYYPGVIAGVDPKGVLFDSRTKKRLPEDADAIVGHTYYLLTKYIRRESQYQTITLKRISTQHDWNLYEVETIAFSPEAAEFFMQYQCRLTEQPVQLIPLWPQSVQSPYILHHQTEHMYFFMSGQNVTQRTFPYAHVMSFQCSEADTSVFRVLCQKRQQLISVGRWKVLRYTYLWRDEIERTAECPKVIVTDCKGNLLPDGEQSLPEKQRISVKAPYDGEVQILKDGFIIDKYKLMSERICEVEDLQYGQEVRILQGLDCVHHILFQKQVHKQRYSDDALYLALRRANGKEIHVSHRLGSIASILADYPKVKLWLLQRLRKGTIKEDAYQMLLNIVKGAKHD